MAKKEKKNCQFFWGLIITLLALYDILFTGSSGFGSSIYISAINIAVLLTGIMFMKMGHKK